jgi:hypothetical protein
MQMSENIPENPQQSTGDRRVHPKTLLLRKKLLIMPGFQLALIGVNCSIMTVVFGVLGLRISQGFSDMAPLVGLSGAPAELAGRLLAYQAEQIKTLLLISYCIAMFSSALITLILSYRFAGPLVRLRSYFSSMGRAGGPVQELSFRTGDFFRDLPPTINTAIHRILADAEDPSGMAQKSEDPAANAKIRKSHLRIAG